MYRVSDAWSWVREHSYVGRDDGSVNCLGEKPCRSEQGNEMGNGKVITLTKSL